MKSEAKVELVQVSLHHGQHPILRDVSLRLSDGVTLLYGANGAGKSSLLKLIAGLQGHAKITGQGEVLNAALTPRAAVDRAKIGYMPQQGGLYDELTAMENLRFRAAMLGVPDPTALCLKVSETYALAPIIVQRVEQLSGGWRQRLAFALTMLAQPSLLLLDEPTAGVDLDAKARIWEQIDLEKQRGTRIIISSHDPHEAYRADHLIHLHRGSIEYNGAPNALCAHFNLAVMQVSRPADPALLQSLINIITSQFSTLFTDIAHDTLRIVITKANAQTDAQEQATQSIRDGELTYLVRWSAPSLEDGLRAALLISDREKITQAVAI